METILVGILSFLAGSIGTGLSLYFLVIKKGEWHPNAERTANKHELENAYLHGKADGNQEAMKRFSIKYEGYVEENNNFLAKSTETGYFTQLMIDGLPVLEKSKNVLSVVRESKDNNIEKLINEVSQTIAKAAEAISSIGLTVVGSKEVKRLIKK